MTTTVNHISDKARFISFDPSGTDWPTSTNDVQTALEGIGSYAMSSTGLPIASEDTAGIARLATIEEARSGTDHHKIITPFTLKDIVDKPAATTTKLGTVELATNTEALAGTDTNRVITVSALKWVTDKRKATESLSGTAMVSTNDQALDGTDNSTIMTPKKVKMAINALAPREGTASETNQGIVRLATAAEVQAGTAREGVSISPYQFARAKATSTFSGTFKAAGDSQMTTLTSTEHAVTPSSLGRNKGSASKFGIVKLSIEQTNNPNTALSSNAKVVFAAGGDMTGSLNFASSTGISWHDTDPNSPNASITLDRTTSPTTGVASYLDQRNVQSSAFNWTCKYGDTSASVLRFNYDTFAVNNVNRVDLNAPVYESGNRLLSQGLESVQLSGWEEGRHTLPTGTVFVSGYVFSEGHSSSDSVFYCYDIYDNVVYKALIGNSQLYDGDGGYARFGFQYFIPYDGVQVEVKGGNGVYFEYALITRK